MKASMRPFVGTWRIVEMDVWDQEYVDMEGPGYFRFKGNGIGDFHFGSVQAETDCRVERSDAGDRIEFTWAGQAEMDDASGRGWAVIENGELRGRIFFHLGEDSMFRASKSR